MAVWNKPQQQDPAAIARIQAQIDADPMVQAFRTGGYGLPNDPWERDAKSGGRVRNPHQLSDYIKTKYRLPEGYDVSTTGEVVYTNETPWLKQAALASLPIAIPAALQAAGVGAASAGVGGGASNAATGGALTNLAGPTGSYSWMYAPSAAPSLAGVGQSALASGALAAGVDAATQTVPLGGERPTDPSRSLMDNMGEFFKNPRNLAALAGLGTTLAMRPSVNSGATNAAMQDANRMSRITEARMRRVDPLHEAVTQLAFGRLPVSSREGINLTRVPLPPMEG